MYYYYCYHYGHTHDARIGKVTMFSGAFGCHGRLRARFSDDPSSGCGCLWKKNTCVLRSTVTIWLWLTVCHGIDGPFIDDFPIKTPIYKGFSISDDIPWYRWSIEIDDFPSYKAPFKEGIFHGYVSHNQMVWQWMVAKLIYHVVYTPICYHTLS